MSAINLCRLKRSFQTYQNEHCSVKETRGKGKKPCKVDRKIPVKVLFHYPPALPSNPTSEAKTVKFENKPRGLHFPKALFEVLIFGGAYIQWGLSTEGNLRFKVDWASHIVGSKFTVFALFYVVFEGNFQKYKPPGGLYLEGLFNGGFFALPV